MADKEKQIDAEPFFDVDRAWNRFEKQAQQKPVPAFWRQAAASTRSEAAQTGLQLGDMSKEHGKDGEVEMKQTIKQTTKQANTFQAVRNARTANNSWRTESPLRRRLRRWSVGGAAAIIAATLITTSLGDKVMAAMQQTFRIQHMVGVGISADDLTAISNLLERGSPEGDRSFSMAQYGSLTQAGGGKSSTVTWEEAEKRLGTPLHRLENAADPVYQPATTLTFQLNVDAVNRLLTRLGSRTTLPAEADGQAIRLHIPDGITSEGQLAGKPARLLQFGKPELTMEDGIDAAVVREAVLHLPVLPDSLRTKLAAIGDWQSTLPVPARNGVATNLQLGNRDAVMTTNGNKRFLVWLDGERMGLLSADTKDFATEAAFQRAAEELVRP